MSTAEKPAANRDAPETKVEAKKPSSRLVSLDAYRGFIMLAMASAGFGVPTVVRKMIEDADKLPSEARPDLSAWKALAYQLDHAAWVGCSFWDLIQPSFMFMVGVAMAYSYSIRQSQGQSYPRMLGHAVVRSLALMGLAVFLSSAWSKQTEFGFVNVLGQIGLGYTFLFLLWNRPAWVQLTAAMLILLGDWCLFAAYPTPPDTFSADDYKALGVPPPKLPPWSPEWKNLEGLAAHWNMNTNVGAAVDRWFLNLFPREKPFVFNPGGYCNLNFLPSLATMIFGLLAGGLLRSERSQQDKFKLLLVAGALLLLSGWLLDAAGICPLVKRLWTPSWALFSTGWTCWMLAGFYGIIDILGYNRWSFPLVVVGMNSIAIYCMSQLMKGFVASQIKIHCGWLAQRCSQWFNWFNPDNVDLSKDLFSIFGTTYAPIVQSTAVLGVLWLICYWLYRQKLFFKI